jgi:methionyl aminopeptidase
MPSKDSVYENIYRENGRKIAQIRSQAVEFAQSHFNLVDIDNYVDTLIRQAGGEPAFKKVPGYKWATCISVNDVLVHGIPKGKIQPGDIVNIDTGMYYRGTTSDCSTTFVVGPATPEQKYFLNVGKKTLKEAIKQAKPGNRIKNISATIQKHIEAAGYNVTRNLTGHGIGETMHQDPPIPCFVSNDPALSIRLIPGMTLAIEVMYMKGDWPLIQDNDGWTLRTRDGSDSAVFEEDVLITSNGPEILTQSSFPA